MSLDPGPSRGRGAESGAVGGDAERGRSDRERRESSGSAATQTVQGVPRPTNARAKADSALEEARCARQCAADALARLDSLFAAGALRATGPASNARTKARAALARADEQIEIARAPG
jgi:hypothetical protein